jgi:magnesium-transporting ATPase (P-type)
MALRNRTSAQRQTTPWHATDSQSVFRELATQDQGLSPTEAERRLRLYGPNRLRPPKKRGPLVRFLYQFHNVLIYVLLIAAVVTTALAHWVDTGVILGVVIINALIGFVQEGKAERALDAIRNMLSQQASVSRGGQYVELSADELVPGDVVMLRSGDKVPADLRLFRTKELRVDEALLTGESVPVEKSIAPVAATATIADRNCMAYAGTLVTYGQATGIVVATGDVTEIGRISMMLGRITTLTTPLLRQMARFGTWLTGAIGMIAFATFAFGVIVQGYSATDMFLAAVGLSVAAIPEGLPAIVTITLAIGVQRMARRQAIIRRLPAVEALGSITVICSDKTGTLTRNEMTVRTVVTADSVIDVSGVGYDPHGGFSIDGQALTTNDTNDIVQQMARAAILCNEADIREVDNEWRLHGDPTEGALVVLGLKAGLETKLVRQQWPQTDIIPFESEHRFMATLHHDHLGRGFIFLKGAPERVLQMCTRQRTQAGEHPLDVDYWQDRQHAIAARGQRLLALAFKAVTREHHELRFTDVGTGFTLLGLVGLIDPPRQEAIEAVNVCQSAGIKVKMITGDHAVTAHAIAEQMGISLGKAAVGGNDLEGLSDGTLQQLVEETNVFARASPEHKLRLVKALQANGHVVAMTGDGVNDAPALKRADVGVAMGIKGTEVSKEAAEMVLADDNFASIVHAVEEGRTVDDNIKKSILFILPTNGGEALSLIAAIVLGRMLPITPVQILWINMITAVTLALSLAFEPGEAGIMRRPPKDPREPIFSGFMVWRIVFVSLILVAGVFGLFLWHREQGDAIEYARTVAVNTLVLFEAFYLLNTRYIRAPVLSRAGLFGNRYALLAIVLVVGFQLLYTYAPFMQYMFQSQGLSLAHWASIVVVASTVFFLVEAEKYLLAGYAGNRRTHDDRHHQPVARRDSQKP